MANPLPNPPPKTPHWTERNELRLLYAVFKIANEPPESYDPRINLFDRINKNMEKSLTDREILDKIKELRNRFEKRCWTRDFRNKDVKMTKALAISEKIWGKRMEMKIESTGMTKRMKLKNAKSLKVNPPEASRPNPTNKRISAEPKKKCQPAGKKQKFKRSCFVSGNVGHVARDCSKMKETRAISKGFVESQFETENKHKGLTAGSVLTSSLPGSLGLMSEQTEQRDELNEGFKLRNKIISALNLSLSNPLTEQTMKFNNLPSGDSQHTSLQTKQRDEVDDSSSPVAQVDISSQPVTHQSSSEQRAKSNDLQCGDNRHVSEQTNKQRDEKLDGSQPVAQDNASSHSGAHQPYSEPRMKFKSGTKANSKFKSGTYQHTSIRKKPSKNRLRYSSYQHTSYQWKRESVTPPILPQPPERGGWGPPHPIAMPLSFTPHPVPYHYPAIPFYHQYPPPKSRSDSYYPNYPK